MAVVSLLYRLSLKRTITSCLVSSIRNISTRILGIETSCDDTGAAIINEQGTVLGESLHSQQIIHLSHGGIIPPIAKKLHQDHIRRVVQGALEKANLKLDQLDAIAVTNQPGMSLSLSVGLSYAKELCIQANKPLIPVHHMQAHALTIRTIQPVEFPFLVLLISGGHCLLAIAKNPLEFLLLGQSLDDAPGEALDKAARRLKLKNKIEFSETNGGQAIEILASRGNPLTFDFQTPLNQYRDCNFSFSGIKNQMRKKIISLENKHDLEPAELVPELEDLCASYQWVITKHLTMRVQRAIEFINQTDYIPPDKRTLVISGGVASNRFISKIVRRVCKELEFEVAVPPPKLCTDNGIMIAWNGMEKWIYDKSQAATYDYDSVAINPSFPIGKDISNDLIAMNIACQPLKLNRLFKSDKVIDIL